MSGVSVAPVANFSIYTSTTQGFALSASVLANIVCLAESESERAHLLLRALLCVAAFVFLRCFFFFFSVHTVILDQPDNHRVDATVSIQYGQLMVHCIVECANIGRAGQIWDAERSNAARK